MAVHTNIYQNPRNYGSIVCTDAEIASLIVVLKRGSYIPTPGPMNVPQRYVDPVGLEIGCGMSP